jgi:hypothetical protein
MAGESFPCHFHFFFLLSANFFPLTLVIFSPYTVRSLSFCIEKYINIVYILPMRFMLLI